MVEVIPGEIKLNCEQIKMGRHLIDIITSGMYNHPLMVIREYIQNAADSIDAAILSNNLNQDEGRIDIIVNREERNLTITDNGTGVSHNEVIDTLCSIGQSRKKHFNNRGFRGIGRLGGIGYCNKLIFETRQSQNDPVVSVTWDAGKLKTELLENNNQRNILEAISHSVTVEYKQSEIAPGRFFCVKLIDIQRFHKDLLMNLPLLHDYLQQVAPVPFNLSFFHLAEKINSEMEKVNGYRQYNVYLNGEQIFRPHISEFELSKNVHDKITDIIFFPIPDENGNNIGKGWFAVMNYRASLPQKMLMRGIRVRQGNIEVGDEYSLADMFSERRFATWHVGEIHVDLKLKTNSRRDGFEQSNDYQKFLEQATLLGRHLSELCRKFSKSRSLASNTNRLLDDFNNLIHDTSFAVNESHKDEIQNKAKEIYIKLEKNYYQGNGGSLITKDKLTILHDELENTNKHIPTLSDIVDRRKLRKFTDAHLLIEDIAKRIIIEYSNEPVTGRKIMMQIVSPYLKIK